MKYIGTISGLFVAVILCCVPAFSDTLLLKTGKSVEGKIIEETDAYVILDYSGISLKYWKEEIQEITKSQPPTGDASQPEQVSTPQDPSPQPTSQSRPKSTGQQTITIAIKEDPKQEIIVFVKELETLRDGIKDALVEAKEQFAVQMSSDGQITEANRKFLREAEKDGRNKLEQMKRIAVPAQCRDLRDYALRVTEAEIDRFSSSLSSLSTYKDLIKYWEEHPKRKTEELKKKYNLEREKISSKYNIEIPIL
ncbi:MAG: hypothetical protein PHV55_01835 [Candidatus Omnitrophica bacterium]|nr:hypothetical protein [Candidatus Omnitrophota bacterium]